MEAISESLAGPLTTDIHNELGRTGLPKLSVA